MCACVYMCVVVWLCVVCVVVCSCVWLFVRACARLLVSSFVCVVDGLFG